MIGCEKIRVRLDDWLDGRLDADALGEVKDHLAFCEDCRRLFDRHLRITMDLTALGRVADRMADPASSGLRREHTPIRLGRMIAAAASLLLAVGTIYYAARRPTTLLPQDTLVEVQTRPSIPSMPTDSPAVALGDLLLRRVDSQQFRIDNAPQCVAVNVETDNPNVHIVWLYGKCATSSGRTVQ